MQSFPDLPAIPNDPLKSMMQVGLIREELPESVAEITAASSCCAKKGRLRTR